MFLYVECYYLQLQYIEILLLYVVRVDLVTSFYVGICMFSFYADALVCLVYVFVAWDFVVQQPCSFLATATAAVIMISFVIVTIAIIIISFTSFTAKDEFD